MNLREDLYFKLTALSDSATEQFSYQLRAGLISLPFVGIERSLHKDSCVVRSTNIEVRAVVIRNSRDRFTTPCSSADVLSVTCQLLVTDALPSIVEKLVPSNGMSAKRLSKNEMDEGL